MRYYERTLAAMCADCGHDCRAMGEMYMLRDELWGDLLWADRSVVASMLCVGCAESRLGRCLAPADFIDCPLNSSPDRSLRLRRAMGHVPVRLPAATLDRPADLH